MAFFKFLLIFAFWKYILIGLGVLLLFAIVTSVFESIKDKRLTDDERKCKYLKKLIKERTRIKINNLTILEEKHINFWQDSMSVYRVLIEDENVDKNIITNQIDNHTSFSISKSEKHNEYIINFMVI